MGIVLLSCYLIPSCAGSGLTLAVSPQGPDDYLPSTIVVASSIDILDDYNATVPRVAVSPAAQATSGTNLTVEYQAPLRDNYVSCVV